MTFYGVEYGIKIDGQNKVYQAGIISHIPVYLQEKIAGFIEEKERNIGSVKPANSFRIMVVGDSIAVGGELQAGEIGFPELLKDRLQSDYPKHVIETFVFGEGGYSTADEVEGFARYGALFMPDVLILSYCHNDTVEAEQRLRRSKDGDVLAFYRTNHVYLKDIPFNNVLVDRFLLARSMNEIFIRALSFFHVNPPVRVSDRAAERIFSSFQRLHDLAQNAGIPVVVAVFPYFEDQEDPGRAQMGALIKQWCQRFGFLHIDLATAYQEYDSRELRASADDLVHPNQLGHKIAAEVIRKRLVQSGMVP